MKALIVDDLEINREMLAVFLEGRATIVFAENGEAAVARVEEALAADAYFDLICMDISMPGMDGHETMKQIRALEATRADSRAIVFMVTGSSSPDDMFDALVHGECDDYITKPLMLQNFLNMLSKHGLS